MTQKADKATIDKRINQIIKLILHGENTSKIYRNPSIQKWGLTTRTIDEYIRRARQEIQTYGEYDHTQEYGRAIERLHQLYQHALTNNDYSLARQIIKDLCQLYGIDGPIKLQIDGALTIQTFADLARLAKQTQEQQ